MTTLEKIAQLREKIDAALRPLVDRDYWLLDVPNYGNAGDQFIWQGTLDYLRTFAARCLGMRTVVDKNISLPENALVLFQGGGNFGDLWTRHQDYRKAVMAANPTCTFILLPQTVWYDDKAKLREDGAFLSRYHLKVFARDTRSLACLREMLPADKVGLLPDMAFWMDVAPWRKPCSPAGRLLLVRSDKELTYHVAMSDALEAHAAVGDWPGMMGHVSDVGLYTKAASPALFDAAYYQFLSDVFKSHVIAAAVTWLDAFASITTTRLHGCIMSILLGKSRIEILDNSYGKNSSFYETWLADCDGIVSTEDESLSSDGWSDNLGIFLQAFCDKTRAEFAEQNAQAGYEELRVHEAEAWKAANAAIAERDEARTHEAEAWKAANAAIAERDEARTHEVEAWKAANAAIAERDEARTHEVEAWKAANAAIAERGAARAHEAEAWKASDTAAAERDEARKREAEAWAASDAAVAERDEAHEREAAAWKAFDAAVVERDEARKREAEAWAASGTAAAERDEARKREAEAWAASDAAVVERDEARKREAEAWAASDAAAAERDEARKREAEAWAASDAAVVERDEARKREAEAWAASDAAVVERDEARKREAEAWAASDAAIAERDEARKREAEAWAASDAAIAERDEARAREAAAWKASDAAIAERDEARGRETVVGKAVKAAVAERDEAMRKVRLLSKGISEIKSTLKQGE